MKKLVCALALLAALVFCAESSDAGCNVGVAVGYSPAVRVATFSFAAPVYAQSYAYTAYTPVALAPVAPVYTAPVVDPCQPQVQAPTQAPVQVAYSAPVFTVANHPYTTALVRGVNVAVVRDRFVPVVRVDRFSVRPVAAVVFTPHRFAAVAVPVALHTGFRLHAVDVTGPFGLVHVQRFSR